VKLFGKWGKRHPKVIVLGGDGMEPSLVERWIASGDLPNFARLRAAGHYSHLGTTVPAESPVAWSSFISGKNPGKTSIFDFLERSPEDYLPRLSITSLKPSPIGKPEVINNRKGGALWDYLSRAGRTVTIIQVPVTFPPEKVRGRMMSGLGVPDLRGSWGTSFYYATDLDGNSSTELGGRNVKLALEGGRAELSLEGPRDAKLPMRFEVLDDARLRITVGGVAREVALEQWSDWFEVAFPIMPLFSAHGIVRFYVRAIRPELRVYQSAINFHPKNPPFAITHPGGWSGELAEEIGLYKTLGWATDTWGLNEGRLDEKAFLEDLHYAFDKRIEITMSALRKMDSDLVISVMNSTDRVQHMFWRFLDREHPLYSPEGERLWGGKILEVYQKLDRLLGEVMAFMGEDTTLFVLSDHGFHSFRRAVNINTWLHQNGWLALKQEGVREKEFTLTDLTSGGTFWPNVDWAKTRAYSMGLGKVYLNLAGREAEGIVGPGKEARDVREAIERALYDLADRPNGGAKTPGSRAPSNGAGASVNVVRKVYRPEEIFSGEYVGKAGDLIVGFKGGYRVSWQTALGGIPPEVFADNARKWSGDHCSFDPDITCGTLLCNRALPLAPATPSIMDLAPTILKLLGVPLPPDLDGKPLL
jgi:predicted AlkP superfamily phosphohydrolase/phosphomutase